MESIAQKIYTATGITTEPIFHNGERILHIGSGSKVLAGANTVDILDLPGVDVVHDLDVFPWPYADNSFDLVFGHNVFEHLEDQIATMEEFWRILKPKGRVVLTVPYFRSVDAFTDSTHEHFFTSRSLNYFINEKNSQSDYKYTTKLFSKIGFWYGWPHPAKNPIKQFVKSIAQNHPNFYDQYLSLLLPVDIVIWELEVIK
jgi:SAM-dependent methyltransferase